MDELVFAFARVRFGIAVARARKEMKISAVTCAKSCEMNRNTLGNYEYGRTEPTLSNFLRLCKLLNLNPWDYYPGPKEGVL